MKYQADNHRAVDAQTASEAAQVIAARKARAEYGKAGRVGACRVESQSPDGTVSECCAFIGYVSGLSETTGRDVRFVLHLRSVEGGGGGARPKRQRNRK